MQRMMLIFVILVAGCSASPGAQPGHRDCSEIERDLRQAIDDAQNVTALRPDTLAEIQRLRDELDACMAID